MRWLLARRAALFLAGLCFSISAVFPLGAIAQSTGSEAVSAVGADLTVGVRHQPPFVIKTETESGNDWDGVGVQLWREVAEDLDISYEWKEIAEGDEVAQLNSEGVDVVVSAIATPEGEQQVDFTQSYYISSLGIAQPRQRKLLNIAGSVLSPRFLKVCLWLSLLLLAVGAIVWFFEHSQNEDMYASSPKKGLWDSFWWAGVTLTTIGYGDKAPVTTGGRIVALLWMLVAIGITSSLTATITSVASQDTTGRLTNPAMLKSMSIGTVENSSAVDVLQQQQIDFQRFSSPQAGMSAVDSGDLDAFVYDAALMRYLNKNEFNHRLAVAASNLQTGHHVFAMAENAPLLESINTEVIAAQTEPDWPSLLERFMPAEES